MINNFNCIDSIVKLSESINNSDIHKIALKEKEKMQKDMEVYLIPSYFKHVLSKNNTLTYYDITNKTMFYGVEISELIFDDHFNDHPCHSKYAIKFQ